LYSSTVLLQEIKINNPSKMNVMFFFMGQV
jgi:hypothetical protein